MLGVVMQDGSHWNLGDFPKTTPAKFLSAVFDIIRKVRQNSESETKG